MQVQGKVFENKMATHRRGTKQLVSIVRPFFIFLAHRCQLDKINVKRFSVLNNKDATLHLPCYSKAPRRKWHGLSM